MAVGTCWPTQATICAMLTGEPLDPHWLMISGELCGDRLTMHLSPASVRILDNSPCASHEIPVWSKIVEHNCSWLISKHFGGRGLGQRPKMAAGSRWPTGGIALSGQCTQLLDFDRKLQDSCCSGSASRFFRPPMRRPGKRVCSWTSSVLSAPHAGDSNRNSI